MEYKIIVTKPVSLNKFYSGTHWTKRATLKNQIRDEIIAQLEGVPRIPIVDVNVTCLSNVKFDLDNTIPSVKFALDVLVEMGILPNDSRKYIKSVTLRYADTIPKGEALVYVTGRALKPL